MKIFYEGTALFKNKRVPQAGIAHYVYNIYKNIVKLDKNNDYEVFGLNFFGKSKDFKENFPKSTKFRLIQYIPGKVWNLSNRRLALPPIEIILGKRADIFIFTQFRLYPTIFAKKSFVMIYDIAFEHYPEFIEKKNLQYLKRRVPEAAKKADRIITISEFTKKDLVKTYNIDPDKIIVAHCAVDSRTFKKTRISSSIKKKYNLPNRYLLYLGTVEPRKNITKLVKAYSSLPQAIKEQFPLVLAGGGGWNDREIKYAIDRASKSSSIILPGYIEEDDIPALYSGAELFLYPSHFEGFGMQILEAMACGTPVITANNSSLPEVGGDAAYYVDDSSVESIKKGIEKLLSEPGLREVLVKRGKHQIKKFSWEKSAQKIIDALNE